MDEAKGFGAELKDFQQSLREKVKHDVYKAPETHKVKRSVVDFDGLFERHSKKLCQGFETNFNVEEIKYYFRELYSKGYDKGLLVYGSLGVGKTMIFDIIHSMAKELVVSQGFQGLWFTKCTAPWLVSERMRSVEEGYTGSFDIATYHRGKLYIDDLGAEQLCFNKYELLEEILFQRHRNKALTMVTTNLTPAEIGKRYGARVFDRLPEMFHMIKWEGESKRTVSKKQGNKI
ncbi:hypothetical protein J0X14_14460 [Muricauda sp. CAU 1633]|uniref:hypothetical protein n=1 Tax=Allomuricauda sp. CAU 1633 TaxID=2816036 RepID=UPI001A8C3B86|nr:hypothetical protein [Muricauda sp. CAU 1633]MBO0323508.1 hypothetical protein [Muricauda sp. CAU 1633]